MSLTLDYTNTEIADMRVSDTIGSACSTQVSRMPDSVPGKVVSVDAPGWLMPKSGFAFTWTLEAELPRDERRRKAA